MLKKAFRTWLVWIPFVMFAVPAAAALPGNGQEALWRNDNFVKTAQAIKRDDWKRAETRDIAMVALFEVGRKADRLESQLQARLDRLYSFAYKGALVLGVYLVLQLVLSLVMVNRLARLRSQANIRGAPPHEGDFRR